VLGEIVVYNGSEKEPELQSFYQTLSISVTEKFMHTLDFLKTNGLINIINDIPEIESISFEKYRLSDYYEGNNYINTKSLFFISYKENTNGNYNYSNINQFTDQAQFSTVLPLLKNNYFASDGGYVAQIKLKGSNTYVYKFLPAADVPQFVRDTVK
jgi:ABC-2 type transport system permease protein